MKAFLTKFTIITFIITVLISPFDVGANGNKPSISISNSIGNWQTSSLGKGNGGKTPIVIGGSVGGNGSKPPIIIGGSVGGNGSKPPIIIGGSVGGNGSKTPITIGGNVGGNGGKTPIVIGGSVGGNGGKTPIVIGGNVGGNGEKTPIVIGGSVGGNGGKTPIVIGGSVGGNGGKTPIVIGGSVGGNNGGKTPIVIGGSVGGNGGKTPIVIGGSNGGKTPIVIGGSVGGNGGKTPIVIGGSVGGNGGKTPIVIGGSVGGNHPTPTPIIIPTPRPPISACNGRGYPIDINGHWAEIYIRRLYDLCIVEGYGNLFKPDRIVTRAELVKMSLFSKKIKPDPGCFDLDCGTPFFDLDPWQSGWIRSAWKQGIVEGFGDEFRPNIGVTRAQAVKIVLATYGYSPVYATKSYFKDVNGWSVGWIEKAHNIGLVQGIGNGNFEPDRPITRAEAAKIIAKMMEYWDTGIKTSYQPYPIALNSSISSVRNFDDMYDFMVQNGLPSNYSKEELRSQFNAVNKACLYTTSNGETRSYLNDEEVLNRISQIDASGEITSDDFNFFRQVFAQCRG